MGNMSNFPIGFNESDDLYDFNVEEFNTVPSNSSIGNISEYIELVKGGLQQLFVLDFTNLAFTWFVEHRMLILWKDFKGQNHRHFMKFGDLEQARANPPFRLSN
ncbi:CACTA en-spm transposon protein [Cucumis melo var. makuwa]|uniref:CACTA en-spm transposon protein n=1 Tax=Cucumis melo var. makuwa TaxID=1194695 RepID=A0A5A7TI02_CUCMM|nr:CACTA en-spm transposon protein [Cucumis melo var. makuwa]